MRSDRMKLFSHSRPMGSLDNAFQKEIIYKFITKILNTVNQTNVLEESNIENHTDSDNSIKCNNDNVSLSIDLGNHTDSYDIYKDPNKLMNITDIAAVSNFNLLELPFIIEPKIDGLSLAIRYNSAGDLISAGTRGDGVEGEDVTANIKVKKKKNNR